MKSKIIQQLRCPSCQSPLDNSEKSLTCFGCKKEFPAVNGVVILLSQDQLTDFFKNEGLGKYLISESRIKQVLESKNFIDGLKEIAEYVISNEFQKKV